MTLDLRALGYVLFLIAAGVVIYAMSGPQGGSGAKPQGGVGIGATDPQRFPWVLEELARPPYGKPRFIARFPTREICEAKRLKMEEDTGRKHRCRLDSRAD